MTDGWVVMVEFYEIFRNGMEWFFSGGFGVLESGKGVGILIAKKKWTPTPNYQLCSIGLWMNPDSEGEFSESQAKKCRLGNDAAKESRGAQKSQRPAVPVAIAILTHDR